jgi:hypothetical protein
MHTTIILLTILVQRSSKARIRNMRTVILKETFKAVSRPECHARGLIPLCVEHPALRIETHISLPTNLFPLTTQFETPPACPWIVGSDCLGGIVPWIEEAVTWLPSYGMPPHSFKLIIDGTIREFAVFWERLRYTAGTEEAILKQCELNSTTAPRRSLSSSYSDPARAPWDLPVGFAQMIRDIAEGYSVVQYDGDLCELWDKEEFFLERKDWTIGQWKKDWTLKVQCCISTDFWNYVDETYRLQPLQYGVN